MGFSKKDQEEQWEEKDLLQPIDLKDISTSYRKLTNKGNVTFDDYVNMDSEICTTEYPMEEDIIANRLNESNDIGM